MLSGSAAFFYAGQVAGGQTEACGYIPANIYSCSAFESLIRTGVRCRSCRIRPSGIALCAPCYPIHPLVERRYLYPVAPSARRASPSVSRATPSIRPSSGAISTICALLSHPLCEFALDGGVLLLGNGKLAAILQGHLAAGHVAHKSGVDQVACMAANKEVAVALGN